MAAARVRRWAVHPDSTVITDTYGEIPCVSRQAMVEAIMDGEAFLARTGGMLVVTVGRQPTDLPGEAVTTHAVVEWRDSARAVLEEERPTQVLPEPAPAAQPAPEPPAADGDGLEEAAAAHAPVAEPDGFDTSQLEEEDVSSIPESVR